MPISLPELSWVISLVEICSTSLGEIRYSESGDNDLLISWTTQVFRRAAAVGEIHSSDDGTNREMIHLVGIFVSRL